MLGVIYLLMFVALLFAPQVWRVLRTGVERLPRWLQEALPLLLLLGAIAAVYPNLFRGEPRMTVDHHFHLLRSMELAQLLHEGHLVGWCDREFAGFPLNLFYPFLTYLFIVVFHALSGLSWLATYAIAELLGCVGVVFAIYLAVRIHFDKSTALLTGLFALLDPGGIWVGGHFDAMHMGMWFQAVATALVLLLFALLPIVARSTRLRDHVGFGALAGFAVLIHPQAILLVVLTTIPFFIAALSSATDWPPLRVLALRFLPAALTAFSLCAFWVIPFVALRNAQRLPGFDDMRSSPEAWRDLVDGKLFNQPSIWMGATLCGLILLSRRKDLFARFALISVLLITPLMNKDALTALHLRNPADHTHFDQLQIARWMEIARLLAMLAAAHAIVHAIRMAASATDERRSWQKLLGRAVLAAAAVLTLTLPGVSIPGRPSKSLWPGYDRNQLAALDQALDRAAQLVGPHERIALYHPNPLEYALIASTVLRGFDIEKLGATSANHFASNADPKDPESLARLGARAILSDGPPPPELQGKLVGTFGQFQLHELSPKPRAWIEGGPGQVEILEWSTDQIRLRVTGSGPGSQVRLALGYFRVWREQSGAALSPFAFHGATWTTLPAHDGELVLRYHTLAIQWIGVGASAGGLVLLLGWMLLQRKWARARAGAADAVPIPSTAEPAA